MNLRRSQVFLALALAGSFRCFGESKERTELLALGSDAVVVGEVRSGQQVDRAVTFTLAISRTLKGPLQPGDVIPVSWSTSFRGNSDFVGSYGLWFLGKDSGGRWRMRPLTNGPVPFAAAYLHLSKVAGPAYPPAGSSPATLGELMTTELAAAVPNYKTPDELTDLAHALLETEKNPASRALYFDLRKSSDPELRFLGLVGLVQFRGWFALAEIAGDVDLLDHLKVAPDLMDWALVRFRDGDPGCVRSIGRIGMSTSNEYLRRDAINTLKYIHTRESLPFLAWALDSTNPDLRRAAMWGMTRFVDNLPIVTPDNVPSGGDSVPLGPAPYRTADTDRYSVRFLHFPGGQAQEEECLRFWKSWWERMKGELDPDSK
jgi:hypothetical protein